MKDLIRLLTALLLSQGLLLILIYGAFAANTSYLLKDCKIMESRRVEGRLVVELICFAEEYDSKSK